MSFSFKNWKTFREQMNREGIPVAKFEFEYYQCRFGIVYSKEQNVFWVAKRGAQAAFPIYLDWFRASVILDKEPYRQLAICKDEAFDPEKPYSPFDFLKKLDEYIGANPTLQKAQASDFHPIARQAIPDEEKIYFQRFMPHVAGTRHVTGANIAKVRKILGNSIAEFCKENNVSIAFTNQPTEKSFAMIENPKKVLDEQNAE